MSSITTAILGSPTRSTGLTTVVAVMMTVTVIMKTVHADQLCTNTCSSSGDQVCGDGGPGGAGDNLCDYGTDCDDCGPRESSISCDDVTWNGPMCPNENSRWPAYFSKPEPIPDGNSYGCLEGPGEEPGEVQLQPLDIYHPQWWYFRIQTAGDADFVIEAPEDVNYAMWGPYDTIEDLKSNCGDYPEPISCSSGFSPTEVFTVTDFQVGEWYALLVSNFADTEQSFNLRIESTSTAEIDCSAPPLTPVCGPGQTSNDARTECVPCEDGTINIDANGGICTACGLGQTSNDARTECVQCEEGTINIDENGGSCTACGLGQTSNDARTECVHCEEGTINSNENGGTCTACGSGQRGDDARTECVQCEVGTINNNQNGGICTACGTGHTSNDARTECVPCEDGTINIDANGGTCTACRAGQRSNDARTECVHCEEGTINNDANGGTCIACALGHTSNDARTECVPCAAGSSNHLADSGCIPCPAGTASSDDRTSCVPCPAGTVATDGAAACTACSVGFASNVARTVCIAIPGLTEDGINAPIAVKPTASGVTVIVVERSFCERSAASTTANANANASLSPQLRVGSVYDPLHFAECCGDELLQSTSGAVASCRSELIACADGKGFLGGGEVQSDCSADSEGGNTKTEQCLQAYLRCVEGAAFKERKGAVRCSWSSDMVGMLNEMWQSEGGYEGSALQQECVSVVEAVTTSRAMRCGVGFELDAAVVCSARSVASARVAGPPIAGGVDLEYRPVVTTPRPDGMTALVVRGDLCISCERSYFDGGCQCPEEETKIVRLRGFHSDMVYGQVGSGCFGGGFSFDMCLTRQVASNASDPRSISFFTGTPAAPTSESFSASLSQHHRRQQEISAPIIGECLKIHSATKECRCPVGMIPRPVMYPVPTRGINDGFDVLTSVFCAPETTTVHILNAETEGCYNPLGENITCQCEVNAPAVVVPIAFVNTTTSLMSPGLLRFCSALPEDRKAISEYVAAAGTAIASLAGARAASGLQGSVAIGMINCRTEATDTEKKSVNAALVPFRLGSDFMTGGILALIVCLVGIITVHAMIASILALIIYIRQQRQRHVNTRASSQAGGGAEVGVGHQEVASIKDLEGMKDHQESDESYKREKNESKVGPVRTALRSATAKVSLPGWSFFIGMLAVQGMVIEALRSVVLAERTAHIVIGVVVLCLVVLNCVVLLRWAQICRSMLLTRTPTSSSPSRASVHCGDDALRNKEKNRDGFFRYAPLPPSCPRLISAIMPRGIYRSTHHRWGMWRPVYDDSMLTAFWFPYLESTVLAGLIGMVIFLPPGWACRGATIAVAAAHFVTPLVYVGLRPHRRPTDSIILAFMRVFNGVACLAAGFDGMWGEDGFSPSIFVPPLSLATLVCSILLAVTVGLWTCVEHLKLKSRLMREPDDEVSVADDSDDHRTIVREPPDRQYSVNDDEQTTSIHPSELSHSMRERSGSTTYYGVVDDNGNNEAGTEAVVGDGASSSITAEPTTLQREESRGSSPITSTEGSTISSSCLNRHDEIDVNGDCVGTCVRDHAADALFEDVKDGCTIKRATEEEPTEKPTVIATTPTIAESNRSTLIEQLVLGESISESCTTDDGMSDDETNNVTSDNNSPSRWRGQLVEVYIDNCDPCSSLFPQKT